VETVASLPNHPPPTRCIALVGMPGSGKSTVGRHVARHLHVPFVDTDHEIERRLGVSIREYFTTHGEEAFRDIESQVVDDLTHQHHGVLATGGGATLREINRRRLHERCVVFYLHASPDELARRLRHDTKRPLLQGADPHRRLRDLYSQRDWLYRETAHFNLETGRPSVPKLINMLLMQLELGGPA
jgi:shikimate kinase